MFVTSPNGAYFSGNRAVTTNAPMTLGVWHHVVGTSDGTTNKIYIDGVLSGSKTLTNSGLATNITQAVQFGNYTGGGVQTYLNGSIDEVGIWSRALDPKEILQLYRRGANRVKYQVRNCTASDCSDDSSGANWKGLDGTNQTYFSKLQNMSTQAAVSSGTVKATLQTMTFSNFTSPVGTSRYFQYRTILESDDTGTGCNYGAGATWCSPELKSVSIAPIHYDSSSASIYGNNGVSFWDLATFAQTLGSGGCPGGLGYNISLDKSTWYYWSGTAWVAANGTATQSNAASVISTNASTFGSSIGRGTVYFKAYLKSSGSQACELDNIQMTGTQ